MNRLWIIVAAVVLLGLALVAGRACTQRQAPSASTSTDGPAGPAGPSIAGRQLPPGVPAAKAPTLSAIELGAADIGSVGVVALARTVEVSGSLRAANSAVVKARVAGELKSLTVREGDAVRPGQVIGQIDNTEYELRWRQAQQQAQASRAQLDIAQRALKNNKALVDQGFISSTALETSVANEGAAQANVNVAVAAESLAAKSRSDATLVAPIAGLVSQRLAQPGERVGVDARIVEVIDLSRMEFEAAVPPAEAAELRVGQRSTLQVDGLATPLVATIARISPSAQAGSRAVLTYFAVAPHPALRQGLFARGSVQIEQRRALAVPVNAVRNDQSLPTVPVVLNGVVVNKVVVLGARGSARGETVVEVSAGLAAGDVYLSGPVGVVRDGTPVRMPAAAAATAPPKAATPDDPPKAGAGPRTASGPAR